MITIRYAELPEGLHARAQAQGRRTIIYLRPGLTAEQRRLSLRRARQSARMGYGPRLSGPGVALAVARHVTGGTLRNVAAAVRRHPIGFLLLSAGFAGLVTWYALVVTVSVRLMLDPGQPPPAPRSPLPARVVPSAWLPARGAVTPPGLASRLPRHQGTEDRNARLAVPRATAHRPAPGPGPAAQPSSSPSPSPAATPASPPSPAVCVTAGPIGVCG
jgi:hypothetical protein